MPSIAIIPARGGSKRIPRKNIKNFCGHPVIFYSIDAAIKSSIFDEVMVSTDDEEIAQVAKGFGAKVPFTRSRQTSDDYATTSDVLKEVFGEYKSRGKNFDYACCIYPAAPFVTPEKIRKAMDLLKNKNADIVMPVVQYSFPPQRSFSIVEGKIQAIFPENIPKRSQDLEPVYHDCGQFYAMNVDKFLRIESLVGENTIPIVVSELEMQDIDNEIDWKIAEMKYKLMGEQNA